VSGVETLNFLKKSLGIIIKRLEEEGVLASSSYIDHSFVPELDVTDAGVDLSIPGLVYKIKVIGDYPVYLNVDRPVGEEYTVVYPGSYYILPRAGAKVYLKAPSGFKTRVRIEALR
jgi:hypothetical protein